MLHFALVVKPKSQVQVPMKEKERKKKKKGKGTWVDSIILWATHPQTTPQLFSMKETSDKKVIFVKKKS